MEITIDDKELKDYVARVTEDLTGGPMVDAMKSAALLVTYTSRKLAPHDTGKLSASIIPEVTVQGNEVIGVVGSNVEYAPYMELGTGVFGKGDRHWPPAAALETWAIRHKVVPAEGKTPGETVAYYIGRRGGLKGREFLQKGITQNAEKIYRLLGEAIRQIVVKT